MTCCDQLNLIMHDVHMHLNCVTLCIIHVLDLILNFHLAALSGVNQDLDLTFKAMAKD